MAINIGPIGPKTFPKACPTREEAEISTICLPVSKSKNPLVRTTKAVNVHTTMVSAKTSKSPYIPCCTGSFTLELE